VRFREYLHICPNTNVWSPYEAFTISREGTNDARRDVKPPSIDGDGKEIRIAEGMDIIFGEK